MTPRVKNEIVTFFQCAACLREKPPSQSPKNFMRLNVGLTATGIQVWCVRHELNVAKWTLDELKAFMVKDLPCDCCPGGDHRQALS